MVNPMNEEISITEMDEHSDREHFIREGLLCSPAKHCHFEPLLLILTLGPYRKDSYFKIVFGPTTHANSKFRGESGTQGHDIFY